MKSFDLLYLGQNAFSRMQFPPFKEALLNETFLLCIHYLQTCIFHDNFGSNLAFFQ